MKKRKDYELRLDINPTFDFIHINNIEVKVQILLHKNAIFELSLNHNDKIFKCKLGPIQNKEYHVSSAEIDFDGITLNAIDSKKLADDVNKIIDFLYD